MTLEPLEDRRLLSDGDVFQLKVNFDDFTKEWNTLKGDITQAQFVMLSILYKAPGFHVTWPPPNLVTSGGLTGQIIMGDDGPVGGSLAVDGSITCSSTGKAFWGISMPDVQIGVGITLADSVSIHAKAEYTRAHGWVFSGYADGELSATLFGYTTIFWFEGRMFGTGVFRDRALVNSSGSLDIGLTLTGYVGYSITETENGGIGTKPINIIPPSTYVVGPRDLGHVTVNLVDMANTAVQKALGGGGAPGAAPMNGAIAGPAEPAPLSTVQGAVGAATAEYAYAGADAPQDGNPAATATQLVVTTPPPSSVTAGTPFGLVVAAEDPSGNVDTSYTGDVALTVYGQTLGGQTVVPVVDGVATFVGLTLDQAGATYLQASADGLTDAYPSVMVNAAAATKLGFPDVVGSVVSGSPFSVTVDALDPYGNVDPIFSGNVTLALASNPGGATLGGTLTQAVVNGEATFSSLTIDKAGNGYTFRAVSDYNPFEVFFSGPFSVTADRLVVTSPPPSSVTAGSSFGLTVTAEDGAGNVDTSFTGPVTLDHWVPLSGKTTATAAGGVAHFSGLTIDQATPQGMPGTYFLLTADGMAGASTDDFTVKAAAATHLSMESPTQIWGWVLPNTEFGLDVSAEDAYGNLVRNFNGKVTVSLGANPGHALLTGTLAQTAQYGTAFFFNFQISEPGHGYTLIATSGSLAGTSPAFNVDGDQLVATTEPPSSVQAGAPFGLVVTAEKSSGSADRAFNEPVTIQLYGLSSNSAITAPAEGGVATFSGLKLDKIGYYSYSVSAPGVDTTGTSPIAVTASNLTVFDQPTAEVTADAPFSLTITAEDSLGNLDPSYSGVVTLSMATSPGGGALGGALSAMAVGGVARFNDVTIDQPGSGYTLQATAAGLSSSTTAPITVAPAGTGTQLVVTSPPPSSIAAGSPFGLVVKAEDSFGNVIASFNGSVTIADTSGDLSGTLTVNAVAGVATFSGLSIDQAWPYDSLVATAVGLIGATTGYVAVMPTTASQLVIPAPSATILAGGSFALQVSDEDPYGNVESNFDGKVTLALGANPGGATLGGTLTATAVDGVATFTGLSISKPGSDYAFHATSPGGISATGPLFDVATDQLVFTTQPAASLTAGSGFGLVVKAENGKGAVDTAFNGSVTVADPSSGQTLSGTTTVTAVKGVATFAGLTLSQADAGETLIATNGNILSAAVSNTFDVVPAAAVHLALQTAPPSNVTAGAGFEVDVAVEDSRGNVETAFNGNVTVAMAPNSANGGLGGTLTVAAVNGVAAFPGLTLNNTGSGYTLQAASSGLAAVTSGPINVTATGATQLVVTAQPPSSFAAGSSFGLVVTAEDGFGNPDTTFQGNVTLADSSGAVVGGALTVQAVNGVATFSGLSEDQASSGDTLLATSSGLNPATTTSFTVTPQAATQLVVWGPFGNGLPGSAFAMAILAEDQYGNVDTRFSGNVTLALLKNPGGATLGGPLTATAVGGQADFSGLTINNPGSGYTLQAAGGNLTATSTAFDVTGDQLAVAAQPPASVSTGAGFGLTVAAQNAPGIVDTSYTGSVTVALVDLGGTGATLGGTLTATATKGVATFSGLTLDKTGSYLLQVTGDSASPTLTNPVAAEQLPTVTGLTVTGFTLASGPLVGGTPVTITGTNLIGVTVKFGKLAATIIPGSDTGTSIMVKSPAGKVGAVNVTVTNAVGTASAPEQFTYVAAPSVRRAAPTSGPCGGGTPVTIKGSNLGTTATATVNFGGVAVTPSSDNGTTIVVNSPAGTGMVNVTVTTAGGASAPAHFTYVAAPTITANISPASGPAKGGTAVTITGTNLLGATVKFGAKAATAFVSKSASKIVVKSPAGTAGPVNVTVTTLGGTATAPNQFTYVVAAHAPPTINSAPIIPHVNDLALLALAGQSSPSATPQRKTVDNLLPFGTLS